MKNYLKRISSLFILAILLLNSVSVALACGPWAIEPVFKYAHAPENPYENFAAGKLGIIKPTQRRVVLFAAYRYLNGGGFSFDEQKDLVDVWKAEFNYTPFSNDDVSSAVKEWVKRRAAVFPKEEKMPDIYAERSYGGYDFFPNCTKSAFETAVDTLNDRVLSHGSGDSSVAEWLRAQDKVFTNCASGRQIPDPPVSSMPVWLQKDREYQLAAADFYSMNYDGAKYRFARIASDSDSVWQETAEYLVGRTLLRQASAIQDEARKEVFYTEAEQNFQIASSRGGKFAESAEKLIGLIKYRMRPKERVNELARELSYQSSNNDLRQNLVDYSWLLDKFESQTLKSEEDRLKALEDKENIANITANSDSGFSNESNSEPSNDNPNDGKLQITFGNEDYSQTWTIRIAPEATDEEAFSAAEAVAGTLTEKMRVTIKEGRKEAYAGRYEPESNYEGGYWGVVEKSLSLLPAFMRESDLTDWLFTFQIQHSDAYLYSLNKFKQQRSDIWLMTAISKAVPASADLNILLDSASRSNPNSPAYQTITYHRARILLLQNRDQAARELIDSVLNSSIDLTTSARNQFLELRSKVASSLDDYLKYSQLKPFAFRTGSESMTIAQIAANQKGYYDPEYYTETEEEYERNIDKEYSEKLPWDNRSMFDYETVESINRYFSLPLLIEAEKSPELPEYLRERFTLAIWTRAILLEDFATASKFEVGILKRHPEISLQAAALKNAKTLAAKRDAAIYLLLKNPILTPFVSDGIGRTDNEANVWDIDNWWCEPYENSEDGEYAPERPAFITDAHTFAANIERKKLIELGDATTYLGERVLAWQKRSPLDKRIQESLYLIYEANGWSKYSCGGNNEIRNSAKDILNRRYPDSVWTKKMLTQELEN